MQRAGVPGGIAAAIADEDRGGIVHGSWAGSADLETIHFQTSSTWENLAPIRNSTILVHIGRNLQRRVRSFSSIPIAARFFRCRFKDGMLENIPRDVLYSGRVGVTGVGARIGGRPAQGRKPNEPKRRMIPRVFRVHRPKRT